MQNLPVAAVYSYEEKRQKTGLFCSKPRVSIVSVLTRASVRLIAYIVYYIYLRTFEYHPSCDGAVTSPRVTPQQFVAASVPPPGVNHSLVPRQSAVMSHFHAVMSSLLVVILVVCCNTTSHCDIYRQSRNELVRDCHEVFVDLLNNIMSEDPT